MQPFSERYPKPLLPIANQPLIVHQIEIMREVGIRKIVVLIGHKGFEIAKVLGDGRQFGVQIRYVEQTSTLGIAHAVGRLEPEIDHPFLLFLGDIFFRPGDLTAMFRLFEEQGGGAVLAAKDEPEMEAIRRNFAISLAADGYVTRVIEKPRHPPNHLKGVGIYFFDLTIFDAIRRTPRTAMRDEYELTDSIQVMIDDGNPVRPASVIEEDINLTHPGDLLYCNLLQAGRTPAAKLVGRDSSLHPEARIDNCVIGSNVTIAHPIAVAHSVIFDDTRVDAAHGFERMIVTPDGMVDCRLFNTSLPLRSQMASA
jgi:dTDP-glucose pyrophosphorylase